MVLVRLTEKLEALGECAPLAGELRPRVNRRKRENQMLQLLGVTRVPYTLLK